MAEALLFEHDRAIPMRDSAILRANVYRPSIPGNAPVIMTVGPYGKDVHFANRNPDGVTIGNGVKQTLNYGCASQADSLEGMKGR